MFLGKMGREGEKAIPGNPAASLPWVTAIQIVPGVPVWSMF